MTPQELKNSILQLAVQGKLVEQREEEGTAEELYRQIQEEKKKLIKDGKIKKEKPLPEITEDEKPFELPKGWIWVRLAQLGSIVGGGTPKTAITDYWTNGNIPWVTPADMKFVKGKYVQYGERNITLEGLNNSSAQLMPKGSIIYSSRAPIGYIAIAQNDITTNQGFKSLVPIVFEINEYVYYCLIALKNSIIKRASGTTFKEISGTEFGLTVIPLPPLEEQKRIVSKIEELLPYVDRYAAAYNSIETLNKKFPDDMQKSILQLAIQGKLVEQRPEEGTAEDLYKQIQAEKQALIKADKIKKEKPLPEITEEEKPFDLPKGWMWVRLANLCEQISDGTHKTPNYVDNGVPFLSVKDISAGYIDLSKIKYITEEEHLTLTKRVKPEKGDVLICRIGTLGKALKIDIDLEFSIFVSLGLIKPINKQISDYIQNVINSGYGYYWIQKNKVGGGTHTFKINLNDLRTMPIPLPPIPEQKRIVAKIEELLPYCKKL